VNQVEGGPFHIPEEQRPTFKGRPLALSLHPLSADFISILVSLILSAGLLSLSRCRFYESDQRTESVMSPVLFNPPYFLSTFRAGGVLKSHADDFFGRFHLHGVDQADPLPEVFSTRLLQTPHLPCLFHRGRSSPIPFPFSTNCARGIDYLFRLWPLFSPGQPRGSSLDESPCLGSPSFQARPEGVTRDWITSWFAPLTPEILDEESFFFLVDHLSPLSTPYAFASRVAGMSQL